MPIAELFLSALLPVLFEKLASPELLKFARRERIDKLLQEWGKMLTSINQVLDDAEDRQLTGDDEVKSWLEDLRNLAYDIEDLLDEFATEYAEYKSKAEAGTSKVRSLLPSCCFRLSPRALMFDHTIRSKMEEMDGRLQKIIARKDGLSLRQNKGKQSSYRQLDNPISTTNLTEPGFVGREDEKREILELLTREEDNSTSADPEVIAIVGMGGVGKTALAQQVYNDASLTFNEKVWVCISDNFDVLSITKSILEETTNCPLSCKDKSLNWLQDELKKSLSGKKFLVVLDDVWNENYGNWTNLLKPFRYGEKGSKIIITTRILDIALILRARPITLDLLTLDSCMTLFAFHAFEVKNFDRPDLEVLGRKIVKRCKGLPLAVKALAGLLRTKVSPHEWEDILNSKVWDLPENEILPALKLSYLHLPSHLRRCFAYSAIFPKDYEIQRDKLIHWWIAEGLVDEKERKDRWNTGLNYFNELVARSLFQKTSSSESLFLMHDLVNDLAKLVAGATYFSSGELEFEGDQNNASFARHASFISNSYVVPQRFKIYHRMERLRSFISLQKEPSYGGRSFLSQKVLCDLLSGLSYLRVLSLTHYHITEVPECIGKLRLLRHLNLSYTDIERLPKSIVALYNLEALMLQGCENLIELPKGMEKLINLRFLDITDTRSLRAMPLYIGNLVGLEMLSKFVVGTENGSRLKELKNLKKLRGELRVSDLHMVREAEDAKDANLRMKEGIRELTMKWSEDFQNFRDEELEAKVLDFLCPHQYLENLAIFYYSGPQFPSWLGSPYISMVYLRLHGCRKVEALPSLGQLSSLKGLCIEGLDAICTIGPEFYGTPNPFPSLKYLQFINMSLWEDWSHRDGTEEVGVLFPSLDHLFIQNCPVLKGRLPSQLSSLVKLEINSCRHMDASSSIISLPSLNELNFQGCNEELLKSLVNPTCLTALVINGVAELTCLNHWSTSSLIKLEKLEINECADLIYLWQDRDVIRSLGCLKSLVIKRCPKFIYFVASDEDIELPSNLETIYLADCFNLEKLPSKMHTLSNLRDLTVIRCPKLVSFPETGIPTSVISLTIEDRETLQSLPIDPDEPSSSSSSHTHGDMKSCLQELTIWGCRSLLASPFSEGRFLPSTLKRLRIGSCRGVESLAEINLDRLQSLQEIEIDDCQNLRSLPQGLHTLSHLTSLKLCNCPALELECFPPLPPGISEFGLSDCPKMKSLPDRFHRLAFLRDLKIEWCESITRFPDGGLPPQLKTLWVVSCGNMKQPVREWLTPLTSLEELWIEGSVGGVGEEEDLVLPLPSSLLYLSIDKMGNVERLSSSLPPSLQTLDISNCPKLRELPQDGLPPSLQTLWLLNCPTLRELPQDGLPPSLEHLYIEGCGILEERCREGSGRYWPLICEIPEIEIEGS